MNSGRLSFFVLSILFIISCQKEDKLVSNEVLERTLSGEWQIVSYQMPKYGLGIYYQGNLISQHTLLTDVGSLYIPKFKAADLNLYEQILKPLDFYLNVGEEKFIHVIEYLIPRENGVFIAFRSKYTSSETESEKFVTSSRIFHRNVEVIFESENRIIVTGASINDGSDNMILERK